MIRFDFTLDTEQAVLADITARGLTVYEKNVLETGCYFMAG